jgi:hypothetical protein
MGQEVRTPASGGSAATKRSPSHTPCGVSGARGGTRNLRPPALFYRGWSTHAELCRSRLNGFPAARKFPERLLIGGPFV